MHIGGLHEEIIFTDNELEKPESAPTCVGTNKDNVVRESFEAKTEATIPAAFPNSTRNPPARKFETNVNAIPSHL